MSALCPETGLISAPAGDDGIFECDSHFDRISGNGNSRVYEYGIGSHFHCFGCVRRSTYTSIDYYGHTTFGYDDFEQIACTEAFICSDRGTQRHDSCSTGFFEPFAQYGIGLYIWKYDKPHFYQLFGCFQRFYGIG